MAIDELWVVRGRHPVLWTVPFYVTWKSDVDAQIINAVPLLSRHFAIVKVHLDAIGKAVGDGWELSRLALEQIADRVSGDPQHYFSWEKMRIAQDAEFKPERRADRDEFLDALYQKGIGMTRDDLEFHWLTFCKHAQDWLLNKEKPVDMYFVKLHNCPLRQNWRYALLTRFPRLGRVLCHLGGARRDALIAQSGLDDLLVSLDLLAMHPRKGFCFRHVEVEHRPTWWKNVERVETERLRILGPFEYATAFMASVRRKIKLHLALYTQWLAAVARPSATDVPGGPAGESRFVPNKRVTRERTSIFKTHHVPIVVWNKTPDWTAASPVDDLQEEEPDLLSMPHLQRKIPRLRSKRGHFLKSSNGKA